MQTRLSITLAGLLFASSALAQEANLKAVHLIKQEAFLNSQVMDYIHLIADENGPRMAGSPGYGHSSSEAFASSAYAVSQARCISAVVGYNSS